MLNDQSINPGVERALTKSQRRLVFLAAEQMGYSALKESKAGRMSEEVLAQVVDEVRQIKAAACALKTVGSGDETNNWMTETLGEGGLTTDSGCAFPEGSVNVSSLKEDLAPFAGSALVGFSGKRRIYRL